MMQGSRPLLHREWPTQHWSVFECYHDLLRRLCLRRPHRSFPCAKISHGQSVLHLRVSVGTCLHEHRMVHFIPDYDGTTNYFGFMRGWRAALLHSTHRRVVH